ncbi:MAG TPA: DUF2306 domain-containing protein [Gemmatimonadaceae bacterium]|nr:DUF2306 domain-containing protein [Gemmatimonadaceae bacterium]
MSRLGWLHFVLALIGLGAGLFVTIVRKGTAVHRRAGWIYAVSLLGVNLTALLIYQLTGRFGPFHAAAIFSLLTLVAGVVPVRRREGRAWVRRHAYWMSGSYVGLVAAATAESLTRIPSTPFWWTVVAASGAVAGTGALIIGTRVRPAVARFERRAAPSPRPPARRGHAEAIRSGSPSIGRR